MQAHDRCDPSLVRVADCRYGRMMYLANDRYLGQALERYGEYSEAEVDLWRQLVQPNWIVADLGANIGTHTVAMARLVPQGFVLAAEPLLYLYYLLCGNLALNGLAHVKAVNAAIGAERGYIRTPLLDYTVEENYGGLPLRDVQEVPGRRVPLIPLDELLPVVHLIKADVEGMEGEVLKGASRLIRECRPILYLEANPGPKQQPLLDQVHALGYRLWWHYAPHFNPANYRHSTVDMEPGVVSFNVLGLPAEVKADLTGLVPIEPPAGLSTITAPDLVAPAELRGGVDAV